MDRIDAAAVADALSDAAAGPQELPAALTDGAILAAVENGAESVELLRAMRRKLAAVLDVTLSARDVAAVSREIDKLTERIDQLVAAQGTGKKSGRDEIARRRAARESAAAS